jgi:DNA-binding transcriptional ArsR family regulator
MPSSNQIAAIAAAMGDPVRINMLLSLRHDGVLTATELAGVGNVAPSTASEHLAKLMASNLVVLQKSGRQRLYSLADGDVCDLVDGVTAMAEKNRQTSDIPVFLPQGVLHSRLCLDHLAGQLGCMVTNALFDRDVLRHGSKGPETTAYGRSWLAKVGVNEQASEDGLRCPLRLCHDWTQDAYHLGGGVAGALLTAFRRNDWMRTRRGDAEVLLTPKGVSALNTELGLDLRQMPD